MFICRLPLPPSIYSMCPVSVTCTSPGIFDRLNNQLPEYPAVLRPSPLPASQLVTTLEPSPPEPADRVPPAAGKQHSQCNYSLYTHINTTHLHIHHTIRKTSNRQWTRLGTFLDVQWLLVISGIETNPGPPQESHSQENLLIAHVNINSITAVNKIDELQQFVNTHDIRILTLTETKLNDDIAPSQYRLHGYHNPLTRHRNRHGGGVAIYIHKSLAFQRLSQLELGDEEWVWAKVKLEDISLLVCCVYLPPNLTSDRLDVFINNFTESTCQATAQNSKATFILGDFNTGNIYIDNRYDSHSGITSFDHLLKDTADMLQLQQIIEQPTRITNNCGNLRDLIFTTDGNKILDSGTLSSFSNLDHLPVYAKIDAAPPKTNNKPTHTVIWDYSKLNAPLLTDLLVTTDWNDILDNDIDTATNLFISAIHTAASAAIPRKRKINYSQQKPWMTSELRRNIRKRDRLFKVAKRTETAFNWDRWRYQRN